LEPPLDVLLFLEEKMSAASNIGQFRAPRATGGRHRLAGLVGPDAMTIFRDRPALLVSFRLGERAALELVYRAYVGSIERYLRALARRAGSRDLGQASVIADLVQEVFVRAFSASGRNAYDGVREYAPYLITIARNCFVDVQRSRGRELATNPQELWLALCDVPEVAPRWYEPTATAVVSVFVGCLEPHLKDVYEQRFVLGRSQEAASTALGLSRRAIRTAEKRLQVQLRRALFRAGISPLEIGRERPSDH
jgi:RNA polymerase sigma factor (sigma-70 family)